MKDIMYNTAFRYNCSISQHRYWLRVVFGPWGRHTESEVLQRLHHCLQQRWKLRAWNQINVDITTCEATGGLQVNNKVQDALWREMLPGVLWPLENMTAILWSDAEQNINLQKSTRKREKLKQDFNKNTEKNKFTKRQTVSRIPCDPERASRLYQRFKGAFSGVSYFLQLDTSFIFKYRGRDAQTAK